MNTFLSDYNNNNNNNNNNKRTSIDTSNRIKNRSQSFSSFAAAVTTTSPTTSITSCSSTYSLHQPHYNNISRSTTDFSSTSNNSTSSNKRFHSSHLGRPPGSSPSNKFFHQKPPIFTTAPSSNVQQQSNNSMQRSQSTLKIAPMKEVEKMITDLKKENFDLKLRLYHLEDMMTKDLDIYQLNEENGRLRINLEDRNKYVEGLEKELAALLERYNQQQEELNKKKDLAGRSIGTQTDQKILTPISPITPASTVEDHCHTTLFESSPEAFGLLPVSTSTASLMLPTNAPAKKTIKRSISSRRLSTVGSWQRIKANEDHMSSVVLALQKVKINSNNSNKRNSDKNNIVDTWLNQNVNDHQQGTLSYPIS